MNLWLAISIASSSLLAIILLGLILAARGLPQKLLEKLKVKIMQPEWLSYVSGLGTVIERLRTKPGQLYEIPWILVIGEKGSNAESISNGIGDHDKAHPLAKLLNLPWRSKSWHIFSKGVLIDSHRIVDSEKESLKLLDDLIQKRPNRPLDGIVVTISTELLLSDNAQKLKDVARLINRHLWLIQNQTGFILPVSIVVTGAQSILGFREFWSKFPEQKDQMFGWSTMADAESEFNSDWIKQGLSDIEEQCYSAQITKLPFSESNTKDIQEKKHAFILFPRHIGSLEDNLGIVLNEIFDRSVYESGASFRGFYFSGQLEGESVTAQVKDLVNEKLFKEFNLARPLRSYVWSRNRSIKIVQSIVALSLVAWSFGILLSAYDLALATEQRIESRKTLAAVQETYKTPCLNSQDSDDYCLEQEQYEELLNQLLKVKGKQFYPALPLSWFRSSVEELTKANLGNVAIGDYILPTLEQRLSLRKRELNAYYPPSAENSELASQYLTTYLQRLTSYQINEERFNDLLIPRAEGRGTGAVKELFLLLNTYLFSESTIPKSIDNANSAFLEALAATDYSHVDPRRDSDSQVLNETALSARDPGMPGIRLESDSTDDGYRFRLKKVLALTQRFNSTLKSELDEGIAFQKNMTEAASLSYTEISSLIHSVERIQYWAGATAIQNPCFSMREGLKHSFRNMRTLHKDDTDELEDSILMELSDENCFFPIANLFSEQEYSNANSMTPLVIHPDLVARESELRALKETAFVQSRGEAVLNDKTACNAVELPSLSNSSLDSAITYLVNYNDVRQKPDGEIVKQIARNRIVPAVENQMGKFLTRDSSQPRSAWQHLQTAGRKMSLVDSKMRALEALYIQNELSLETTRWYECLQQLAHFQIKLANQQLHAFNPYVPSLTGPKKLFPQLNAKDENKFVDQSAERADLILEAVRPFIQFFDAEDASLQTPEAPGGIRFWRESLAVKDSGKESKLLLDQYLKSHMSDLNYSNCASLPMTDANMNSDLYSRQLVKVFEKAGQLCRQNIVQRIQKDYELLYAGFERKLKNLYPFASLEGTHNPPDLQPDQWLGFKKTYAAELDGLGEILTGQVFTLVATIPSAREKLNWLKKMQYANQVLDQLYVDDTLVEVRVNADFEHLQLASDAISQILHWRMKTNSPIEYPNANRDLVWSQGQDLELTITWLASDFEKPDRVQMRNHLAVRGNDVVVSVGGPWAPLRFAELFKQPDQQDQLSVNMMFPVNTIQKQANGLTKARMRVEYQTQDVELRTWQPLNVSFDFPR